MFHNIGGKIKGLALFVFTLEVIAGVLGGFAALIAGIAGDEVGAGIIGGILVAVVAFLFAWISNFLLYGFGQLVENSDIIARNVHQNNAAYVPPVPQPVANPQPNPQICQTPYHQQ